MNYILQGKQEGERLDEQTLIEQFSLDEELKNFKIAKGTKVLDAGCGSGILCRYLENNYQDVQINGCDLSKNSLDYAQTQTKNKSTRYFTHNIVENILPDKYDHIFNRLVAHHLGKENVKRICKHFYQALNPHGQVCIIDTDGIFLNLGTLSSALQEKMYKIKSTFHGDLEVARYIPAILEEVGFKDVSWRIQMMDFQGENKKKEVQQWKERFESSLPFYVNLFGNEFEAKKFFKEYTTEAAKTHVPLFYNKFIITAKK
jgi:cyclopropane fatty-acyl-phospholipid synthase-like methyltransferase